MSGVLAPRPVPTAAAGDDVPARRGLIPSGRGLVAIALAVAALAASARVSVTVPGSPVPQSLQTLAVVLAGAWLGAPRGGLAVALYLLVGALGAPVFADGAAGTAHLVGPTAGYLIGFVLAAMLVGWGAARSRAGLAGAFAVFLWMVLGHVLILAAGWLRLSLQIGAAGALEAGVLPFLWGGVAKSAGGVLFWYGGLRYGGSRYGGSLHRPRPSAALEEPAPDRVAELRGGGEK